MIKRLFEKLKTLRLYFVSKRCFKVTYKSKLNGNVGIIGYYGKSIDDVRRKFEKEFDNSIVLDVSYNVY
jgi:hypothetical protein